MTQLLPRIGSSGRTTRTAVRDGLLLSTAARAAGRAAVTGLGLLGVLALLVWWAEDRSGTDLVDVARATGQLWTVAHGAWLELPSGRLGLTPLGLALLPLLLLHRAGRRVAVTVPERPVLHVALGVAVPYAVLAAVVAEVSAGDRLRPLPLVAAGCSFAVAALGAAAGARGADVARLPGGRVRAVLLAALTTVVLLCGAGALLAGAALALDAGTATELAEAAEPGAVGGLGMLLLGASLVPNAAVWGASWLAGPGFAVGVGTAVTPFGTELGPVPALPLLAALPAGPPPSVAALALLVPVLAGVAGGRLLHRARLPGPGRDVAVDVVAVGVVAGALLGALAALSGGPLGGEHLAAVGPSAWRVAPVVAGETVVGVALALAVLRRRGTSRP